MIQEEFNAFFPKFGHKIKIAIFGSSPYKMDYTVKRAQNMDQNELLLACVTVQTHEICVHGLCDGARFAVT